MASKKKDIKKELEETAKELKEKGVSGYENIIDRLNNERKKISREVDRDYKEARRYVRSNPEEGLLIALIGGLAIGLLLGRSSK
jgi:ElaB/YqjD/DUF883 family membrane-anchored ribosome-binding protein